MKTIVVTGATSGIGKEEALQLLKNGHRVISGARNMQKADKTKAELIENTGNELFESFEVDLANFESVKRFADLIRSLLFLFCPAGTVQDQS
jgi:short-subunit dehydrogenase